MKKIDLPSIVLLSLLLGGVCFWLFGPRIRRAQTAAAPPASQDSQDSSSMEMPAKAPREFDFPYYSLRDGFESTMFLVNHSSATLRLRIAVHGLDGEAVRSTASIQPGQKLSLPVRGLLKKQGEDADGPFGEGSIAIKYKGGMMAVVGQMSIANPALSLVHESEMTENDPGMSDVPAALNGLWWGLGGGQEAFIYVSNTAARPVIADVFLDYLGARHASQPLMFRGHETKVLSIAALLNSLNLSPSQAPEGGITIIGRGGPALIAEGATMDPATGFSTTLHFLPPQMQLASTLVASGVPIGTPTKDSVYAGAGTFIPHAVVRNLANSPQQVTISVEYPGKNNFAHYDLPSLTLGPRATEDVSLESVLDNLPLPLPFCTIRIAYSGPPGSAVGEVASVEQQGSLVVDNRLANEGNGYQGSGGNPWHIGRHTQSILFLTDMGDKPASVTDKLIANGVTYYLPMVMLAPHETQAIDIGQLLQTQKPDLKGTKMPSGAKNGDIVWDRMDNVPVAGRVVVIDRKAGVASNFDCCTCPCPASYAQLSVSPSSYTLNPPATESLTATARYSDRCGDVFYCNVTSLASWSTNNSSVATVSGGTVTGAAGGGTATITASYTGDVWVYDSQNNTCNVVPTPRSSSSSITVQGPARLVRYNTSCTPNGVGPLEIVSDGNIVDCSGGVHNTSPACGVYENFTYQLVDQSGKPFPSAYTINEFFSNFSSTGPPEPSQSSQPIAAGQPVADLQTVFASYPSCLGSNDHASFDQTFKVTVGSTPYNLSTVVSISYGRFNGTYEVNDNIVTP